MLKVRVLEILKTIRRKRDIEWLKPTCKVRDKKTEKANRQDRVSALKENHNKITSHEMCESHNMIASQCTYETYTWIEMSQLNPEIHIACTS
jgi:hypothetical protein